MCAISSGQVDFERALETADVEIDDFAHAIIVTSAPSPAPDGERMFLKSPSEAAHTASLGWVNL